MYLDHALNSQLDKIFLLFLSFKNIGKKSLVQALSVLQIIIFVFFIFAPKILRKNFAFFRSDLLEIIRRNPSFGTKILFNLSNIMATRLKKSNSILQDKETD